MPGLGWLALKVEASNVRVVSSNKLLMLNQKGQNLKIITVLFSVFVLLLSLAPAVLATDSQSTTNANPILFTNEFVLNGKRMIMETRIYEAPASAQPAQSAQSAQNAQITDTAKPFINPVDGKVIKGFNTGHYAVDYAGSAQSEIWAAGAGTVEKVVSDCEPVSAGCGGGYGNQIIINHGNGLSTMYAHLSTVAVKAGDVVSQSQVIGMMGQSGNVKSSQGIHLHFEVRNNGLKKDPADYIGE
jgi:murein DD-endopeptidase MepM/ murein hydrolase activator NlpD